MYLFRKGGGSGYVYMEGLSAPHLLLRSSATRVRYRESRGCAKGKIDLGMLSGIEANWRRDTIWAGERPLRSLREVSAVSRFFATWQARSTETLMDLAGDVKGQQDLMS